MSEGWMLRRRPIVRFVVRILIYTVFGVWVAGLWFPINLRFGHVFEEALYGAIMGGTGVVMGALYARYGWLP